VVVRTSVLAKPYIHWLFFCAGILGQWFFWTVDRSETVLARVVQVVDDTNLRPNEIPKAILPLLVQPLQRPEEVIDSLQPCVLNGAAVDDVDCVLGFDAEALLVDGLRFLQRRHERGGAVFLTTAGENQLEVVRLMKRRLEELADQLIVISFSL
jgi:hypothetical protein